MSLHEVDVRVAAHDELPPIRRTFEPVEEEADPRALRLALLRRWQLLVLEGQLDGWVPSGRSLARLGSFKVGCLHAAGLGCACLLRLSVVPHTATQSWHDAQSAEPL